MEPYSGNWLKNVKTLVASSNTTEPAMLATLAYDVDSEVRVAALNNPQCPFEIKLYDEVVKAPEGSLVSEISFVQNNHDRFVSFLNSNGMTLDDVDCMPKEWFSSLIEKS